MKSRLTYVFKRLDLIGCSGSHEFFWVILSTGIRHFTKNLQASDRQKYSCHYQYFVDSIVSKFFIYLQSPVMVCYSCKFIQSNESPHISNQEVTSLYPSLILCRPCRGEKKQTFMEISWKPSITKLPEYTWINRNDSLCHYNFVSQVNLFDHKNNYLSTFVWVFFLYIQIPWSTACRPGIMATRIMAPLSGCISLRERCPHTIPRLSHAGQSHESLPLTHIDARVLALGRVTHNPHEKPAYNPAMHQTATHIHTRPGVTQHLYERAAIHK